MIERCLRLIRKHPNVVVLLLGIWIAAVPIAFVHYVEDCVWASGMPPTGLDAILCDLHDFGYGQAVAVAVFFLGMGTSVTAIGFMVRPWVRPWLRPN